MSPPRGPQRASRSPQAVRVRPDSPVRRGHARRRSVRSLRTARLPEKWPLVTDGTALPALPGRALPAVLRGMRAPLSAADNAHVPPPGASALLSPEPERARPRCLKRPFLCPYRGQSPERARCPACRCRRGRCDLSGWAAGREPGQPAHSPRARIPYGNCAIAPTLPSTALGGRMRGLEGLMPPSACALAPSCPAGPASTLATTLTAAARAPGAGGRGPGTRSDGARVTSQNKVLSCKELGPLGICQIRKALLKKKKRKKSSPFPLF